MEVTLIAKTTLMPGGYQAMKSWRPDQGVGSDAEKLVEIAGRECYDSGGKGRNSQEYHKHILEVGHGSVLEHATWSFLIRRVSRNLTHELVRHRVGTAFSQHSTRYCDETDEPCIDHPLVERMLELKDPDTEAIMAKFRELDTEARVQYERLVNRLQDKLVADGCDKLTARKQGRAAAARRLPNGLQTSLVLTVNARSGRGCIDQRANPAADAEIRQLFMLIHDILVCDSPQLFGDYVRHPSPDGLSDHLTTQYRKV